MLGAAATGFATGIALILPIGAQNTFVLRQGLRRAHVFAVCLVCALSDAILISAGILGFGAVTARFPQLPLIMTLAGAAFLFGYGALRLRAAWSGGAAMHADGRAEPLGKALMTCLALTWLNPHVYLDTLALIGAVSTQFNGQARFAFGIGAVVASFVFFFCLGYGARLLAPLMRSDRAWRWLDASIGLLMWALAAGLVRSALTL